MQVKIFASHYFQASFHIFFRMNELVKLKIKRENTPNSITNLSKNLLIYSSKYFKINTAKIEKKNQ